MNNLLSHLPYVKIYLDDILIFSPNAEVHFEHVKTVLLSIKNAGVSINLEKSIFGNHEVEYLGHKISAKGIQPLERGIENLKKCIHPKNVKQLQKLLGCINWLRPFIKDLSIRILPLTDLLKNKQSNSPIHWNSELQKIVDSTIAELNSHPVIFPPNWPSRTNSTLTPLKEE